MILKTIGLLGSIVIAVIMTAIMLAALYANRTALPVVLAMFLVIIAFGAVW